MHNLVQYLPSQPHFLGCLHGRQLGRLQLRHYRRTGKPPRAHTETQLPNKRGPGEPPPRLPHISLQLGLCLGRICKPAPPRPSRQPQRRGPRRQQLLLFMKLILRADRGGGLGARPELECLRGISHLILTAALGGNESVRAASGPRSDNRRLC